MEMNKRKLTITVEYPDNIDSKIELLQFIRDTIQRELEREIERVNRGGR